MVTPNIDRLGKQGMVFSRAYCQQAICGPTRNSFLSGRRPQRTKSWNFVDSFREVGQYDNSVKSIPPPPTTSFFVISRTLNGVGCTDSLLPPLKGVSAPHQCPLGVGSKLPLDTLSLYADVRLVAHSDDSS